MRNLAVTRLMRSTGQAAERQVSEVVGGPARAHVVVMLACVLALNTADQATVGAAGSEIERGLGIGNTELGILAAVTPIMGALGAFGAGALVDRRRRTRLLSVAIAVWSAAMLVSGFAVSYEMLLLTRLALGLIVATAGPAVASLTGDYFPAAERGRIYGFILAGELLGAAVGFLISGEIAGVASWRWSFGVLAAPGFALAVWIWRSLPEPARGGQSRLSVGATEVVSAEQVAGMADEGGERDVGDRAPTPPDDLAEREVERQGVRPRAHLVLRSDPARLSARQAIRYVLSVPSNVLLIIASALGYFFLQGLQTFAVIFLQRRYGVAHGVATLLLAVIVIVAIAGAIVAGRLADGLIARGYISARVTVAAGSFVVAALVFAPAFAIDSLGIALIFYLVGALAVAAPNPPLDAARLDIMPSALWGRAEGVRTVLRDLTQGAAPFVFGLVSDQLAARAAGAGATGFGAQSSGRGLQETFLIMLVPLLIGGLLLLRVIRTYPRDVATALASEEASRGAR